MHAKLERLVVTAAKDLLPGFSGSNIADVAAHLGVERAAFKEALPEYSARFPFDRVQLFHVLVGLFRSKRIRELVGASTNADVRKIAVECNAQDRWDAIVHGDKLIETIQSFGQSLAAGESIKGQALLDLITLTLRMSLPFVDECKILDALGDLDEPLKKCSDPQKKVFRDALWTKIERDPELLVNSMIQPLVESIGLDGGQYDVLIERCLAKKSFDTSTISSFFEQRLVLPGGVDAVKKHYLATLNRAAKKAPQYAMEPPSAILDDVIEPTLAVVLLSLDELRQQNNFWLVGTTLAALLSKNSDAKKAGGIITNVLAKLSDDDISAFVDAATHIELYDDKLEKRLVATLHAALEPIIAARSLKWSKRGVTLLKKIGLMGGARPTLPKELPQTEKEAFAFLGAHVASFKNAKPANDVPDGLPASLAAFYARASQMLPYVDKPKALPKLAKDLLSWMKSAEEDDEECFSEGIPLKKLSPRKEWCVFGKDASGDFFFIDPARPALIFRYRHDEACIEAEAQSLWAFVTYFGALEWAEEEGLERVWLERMTTEGKRAAKAFKAR